MILLLSEGQMSDYKGAALMLDALPTASVLLGDRGYDADWFRHALTTRGITPCIPSKNQPQNRDPARPRTGTCALIRVMRFRIWPKVRGDLARDLRIISRY